MAGRKYQIDTPNGSVQHLSEEQLVIAGISAELAAASEGCSRIARMRPEISGAQWRGVVAGTAEELGFLADRIHDTRIALQAYIAENGGDPDAPTRRELAAVRKKEQMDKRDGISGALYAAAIALSAHQTLGPVWSYVGAGALTAAALIVARFTPVRPQAPKVAP